MVAGVEADSSAGRTAHVLQQRGPESRMASDMTATLYIHHSFAAWYVLA